MARRPDPAGFDIPLTREDLAKWRHDLSISEQHVRDAYREANERCRMDGDGLARASAIQELVTVWKLLWAWRQRRARGRG